MTLSPSISLAQKKTVLIIKDNIAIKQHILASINNAHDSIEIVIYGFTDLSIAKALTKAQKRGVHIKIILESSPYRANNENKKITGLLKKQHIPLKLSTPIFKFTHQKSIIIDHKQLDILTGNFTYSAQHQRNYLYTTHNPRQINEALIQFTADWLHINNSQKQSSNLIWSPDNSKQKINTLLNSAHSTIKIEMQSLNYTPIINLLIKKADQGVHIQIILPSVYHNNTTYRAHLLESHHIQIHYFKKQYLHAKMVVIDSNSIDHTAFIGSMNFTQPGILYNRELGVIFHNDIAIMTLTKDFQKDWES